MDRWKNNYVTASQGAAGVANTAIVLAAAEVIVSATDRSVYQCSPKLGFVKRKGSTSAKLPIAEFEKGKAFLTSVLKASWMTSYCAW